MKHFYAFTITFSIALIVGTLINVFIFDDPLEKATMSGLVGAFGAGVALVYLSIKKKNKQKPVMQSDAVKGSARRRQR